MLSCFFVLLEDGDEKKLNCEGLGQSSSQIHSVFLEQRQSFPLAVVISTSCNPGDKKKIGTNADNSIGHQTGPKLFVFDNKGEGEEEEAVEDGIEGVVLVGRGEADPLDDDKFVV